MKTRTSLIIALAIFAASVACLTVTAAANAQTADNNQNMDQENMMPPATTTPEISPTPEENMVMPDNNDVDNDMEAPPETAMPASEENNMPEMPTTRMPERMFPGFGERLGFGGRSFPDGLPLGMISKTITGTVMSVNGDSLMINATGGRIYSVYAGPDTMIVNNLYGSIPLAAINVGDIVVVRGSRTGSYFSSCYPAVISACFIRSMSNPLTAMPYNTPIYAQPACQ